MAKVIFPWGKTPKGYGFFVPTLDPQQLLAKGMIDSQRYRGRFKAHIGLYKGKLGVLFLRV